MSKCCFGALSFDSKSYTRKHRKIQNTILRAVFLNLLILTLQLILYSTCREDLILRVHFEQNRDRFFICLVVNILLWILQVALLRCKPESPLSQPMSAMLFSSFTLSSVYIFGGQAASELQLTKPVPSFLRLDLQAMLILSFWDSLNSAIYLIICNKFSKNQHFSWLLFTKIFIAFYLYIPLSFEQANQLITCVTLSMLVAYANSATI